MNVRSSYGVTPSGVELTESVLEELARKADAGLDVTTLRRRPGRPAMGSAPAHVLAVRIDPDLRSELDARVEADHTTASALVREALRRYLRAG